MSGNLYFLISFTYFAQPPLFFLPLQPPVCYLYLWVYYTPLSYLHCFWEEVGCNFYVSFYLGLGVFLSGFLFFGIYPTRYSLCFLAPWFGIWHQLGEIFTAYHFKYFFFSFSLPLFIIPLHVYYTFLSCPTVLRYTAFLFPVFFFVF